MNKGIPFSAFWLRSSVVSVLISLISDTWPIGDHLASLLVGPLSVDRALHCCMGLAQPYLSQFKFVAEVLTICI
ncbi:hypothetical protein AMTRI_Chr02g220800 [Amborella trichopoda]